MSTSRQISLFILLSLAIAPLAVAPTPTPAKEAESLEEMTRHPSVGPEPDKIAPSMNGMPTYKAHAERLRQLYSAEVMDPLSDHFDRTVPGGFKAALERARRAGVPDGLLAEIESMRAVFDVNYPALVATLPRMRDSWQHWDEKASVFPNRKEFEIYLRLTFDTVERERKVPGSFAQTAMWMRKHDIARAVYNDLRQVDGSSMQYALMHDPRPGAVIPVEGWMSYVNPKSHLAINKGTDVTGQPFGPQVIGKDPAVPEATYRAVADAVPDDFWKPYRIPAAKTAQR